MSTNDTKPGKILLVGFGPGAKEHMSLRALEAMEEADVVIGYTTYIKLVKDLLVGKEIIRKGMTEEIDRCIEAYDQAKMGKTVALISSGDIGVYGMAGPTFEVLLQEGWTPDSDITVEIIPGATALSACASLVGAPLTHDFCSISLSDLLTRGPPLPNALMPLVPAILSSPFIIQKAAAAMARSNRHRKSCCATASQIRLSPLSNQPIAAVRISRSCALMR